MLTMPTCQYGSDLIRSFNDVTLRIQRSTRKLLFLYSLWRPAYTRCREKPAEPIISPSIGLPAPLLNGVRLATWNIHSLGKKCLAVADTILAYNMDLIVVTESWHRSPTDVAVRHSSPPGFSFVGRPRPGALDDPLGSGLSSTIETRSGTKRSASHRIQPHLKPLQSPSRPAGDLWWSWESTSRDLLHQHAPSSMSSPSCWSSSHSTIRKSSLLVI